MVTDRIEHSLVGAFAGVSGVFSVYVVPSGDVVEVFTIIDEDDEETYEAIYERERSIIRQHPDFHFDFTVIALRGRPIDELVPSCAPVWQRTGAAKPCPNVTSI
jgi:hypothetical protein